MGEPRLGLGDDGCSEPVPTGASAGRPLFSPGRTGVWAALAMPEVQKET